MNCKPGDLAIVISEDPGQESNCGAVVRVLDCEECYSGEWRCVCEYRDLLAKFEETGEIRLLPAGEPACYEDRNLRPIRPGGITDEEVRDLYAPKLPEVA